MHQNPALNPTTPRDTNLGRSGLRGRVSWFMSAIPNASPFIAAYVLVSATLLALVQGQLHAPGAWLAVVFVAVPVITGPLIVKRAFAARAAFDAAFEEGLGPTAGVRRKRLQWTRIVVLPVPVLQWGIRRNRN